jgi:hypothetical protein
VGWHRRMTAKIDAFIDDIRSIPSFAADAAAPEIEITPAMIEAGVDAFCGFDRLYDTRAKIVEGVFRAMEAARSNLGVLEKMPKADH